MLQTGEIPIQISTLESALNSKQYLMILTNKGRIFAKANLSNDAPWTQIAIPSA